MADETEVTEKKPAKKKPAAAKKKPAAKKPAAKPKKAAAAKKTKKAQETGESEQLRFEVEPEIVQAPGTEIREYPVLPDDDDDDDDDIEDAEILAETPASEIDATIENPPVALSPEEQELQALYGEDL